MKSRDNYHVLYAFFNNVYIRWLRVFSFFLIGFFVYIFRENVEIVSKVLPLYGFLLLQELFIFQKLNKKLPSHKITESSINPEEFFDYNSRFISKNKSVKEILHQLLHENEVRYFNDLLSFKDTVSDVNFDTKTLFEKALDTVKKVKGEYIHGIDMYASFLLLSDEANKMLFNAGISEEDVLVLLSWVRKEYLVDERKKFATRFNGSGVFDFFVFGWSSELTKYANNLTKEVLSRVQSVSIGRNQEYDLMITALSKNSSSNVLLVGEAGVGKTSLVIQFISDSNAGTLPNAVSNKIVFKLYPERLLAGISNQGELEERFNLLFSELMHAGNIVVYIPNIENIFGGGGINMDISGVLIEYLKSSRLKIIGSITPSAFQTFVYPKQELRALFDVVVIDEPDSKTATYMVLEKAKELKSLNRVSITYMAIKETCKLSSSYLNDGTAMPGRAIRLLDDVIAYSTTHGIRTITEVEVRNFVQEKTHIVLDKPSEEESKTLLNLESEIHKRIVSQNEAVSAISDAMRRVRSGMKNETRPIASFLFLGPTGVGKTETAKALAFTYFGDEKAMIRLDMSEYQRQDSIERFLGAHQNEGYEETVLDKIHNHPFSLILLDEFEKAHPQIIDLFLQVFDEGHLTDNRGKTISFKDAIIIATSNAGSEFIREQYQKGVSLLQVKQELIEKILSSNIFKPELVNRFDDVIVFKPLSEADVVEVAKLFLQEVSDELKEKQILLSYEENVPEFIAKNSYSVEFGARNVRRFIEQSVENQLSRLILVDTMQNSRSFVIKISNNTLVIE